MGYGGETDSPVSGAGVWNNMNWKWRAGLSSQDRGLEGKGEDLTKVAHIDVGGLHPAVSQARFTVMRDVTNPLTGPDGATYTFGKQKGGTPEILDILEGGMIWYAALIKEKLDVDVLVRTGYPSFGYSVEGENPAGMLI